ncbi:49_t:CDS:10, partial [Entrophospora sp. SA101]
MTNINNFIIHNISSSNNSNSNNNKNANNKSIILEQPNLLLYPKPTSTPSTPITAIHNKRPFIQQNNKSFTELLQEIFSTLQYNQLKLLCSETPISPYDLSVWESILMNEKFFTTNTGQDAYDVEIATVSLAIELGHILSSEFTGDIPFEAYNSLFLVRIFTKHFAGNMTCNEIHKQFEESQLDNNSNEKPDFSKYQKLVIDPEIMKDSRLKAEQLIDALLKVITNLDPISNLSSYEYYQETLNTFLVLLSTQIHQPCAKKIENNYFLNILFSKFSDQFNELTKRLINNFIEQKLPPYSTNVVYNAYSYLFPSRSSAALPTDPSPIAERSLLILLLLASQSRILKDGSINKFREAIKSLKDVQGSENTNTMNISFRSLYKLICRQLLQILRLLYDGIEGQTNYSQMYILLTILLLLSQDEIFNENIQKIIVIYQPWFTERLMKSISLAGLTYLDVYFHTSSLAILANIGNSMKDMHLYVAQRLANLFEIVSKKYLKLLNKLNQKQPNDQMDVVINYFQTRISEVNLRSPSAEEISEVIVTSARTWSASRLKEFPELKFKYGEELESQEFFCPYVWSLVYQHTWIYWDEDK